MKKVRIHHVDSFTTEIFGGNPTVTVIQADALSEIEMKKIAREMNLSESGFIISSKNGNFRLRYFTPTGDEIKFCGHATVGALHSIVQDKLFGVESPGLYPFQVETNAGLLPMEIDLNNPEDPLYRIESPVVKLETPPYSLQDLQSALDIPTHALDWSKPLMLDRTQNYLYLAIPSLEELGRLDLDFNKATAFASKHGVPVFCFLTPHAFHSKHHVHSRGYAPAVGVPEDPFTGSMQGGLVAYLIQNRMISPDLKVIKAEQGHFMGRPGTVTVEILNHDPFKTRLLAQAKHVFSAEIVI